MRFQIREDARDWFRDIQSELKSPPGTTLAPNFDVFYFCFIAGIATMQKKDATVETADFVDDFPGPYKTRGRLLVGLFLSKELESLGIALEDKKKVREAISKLVDPEAQNFLSDDGVREFNRYAHGGYDVLQDWFDDRPRVLEIFLPTFRDKVKAALSEK